MNILLTGPTGFIGPAFIRRARSRGHQIAGLIIPSESIPSDLPATRDLLWLRGTLQEAPWQEILAFHPDVCVHMAWITTPRVYLESPENLRFLQASITFLRMLREIGVRHIFGLGTCVEYRITNEPLSEETTPVNPTTTYARCKNELRQTMESDARQHEFAFCWGRVFYPYGPREHPSRLCSSIIQKLTREESIVLKTPDSTKDYIYIEDLADALLLVLEKKFSGTINLGTGIGLSVREIARTIGEMMGKAHLIQEASPPEIDPLGYVVADPSRLHQLGWRPAYNLRQGLQKLLDAQT
jgi:nucleoside-diphosphate-sugar epimerase